MELINSLHAVAVFVVAISGLLQLVLKKGGATHAITGFIYLASWLIIVATGPVMGDPLISLFGVFGFYMALTGWRYASRRRKAPSLSDKLVVITALCLALTTLGWGLALLFAGNNFGIVAIVLGALFSLVTILDILEQILGKKIRKTSKSRKHWLFEHMTRMLISYLTAMTAFMVINRMFSTVLYNWLVPVGIGVPLIFVMRSYQRKQLAAREKADRS